MALEDAKRIGAMGVFEAKYGKKVKVYTIGKGDNVFSREICGLISNFQFSINF